MSSQPRILTGITWKTIAALLATVVFLVLFRIGMEKGRASTQRYDRLFRITSAADQCRQDATFRDDLLPPLSAGDGQFPLTPVCIRRSYRIGEKQEAPPERPDTGVLYGPLNAFPAYTLEPLSRDQSFFYLGYVCSNEEEGLDLLEAVRERLVSGGDFESDLSADAGKGTLGMGSFYRLRHALPMFLKEQGVPLVLRQVINEQVPVYVEDPTVQDEPGGWVVYLDYHVEYIPYPGRFPMTPDFIESLRETRADFDRS